MGYRGYMGNGAHGQFTWAIAAQGVSGTRGMGHMGNRSHGQLGQGNGAYGPEVGAHG